MKLHTRKECPPIDHCVLTIGTITHALAARRLLTADGIAARLLKSTGRGAKGGCAYGIEIRATDLPQASRILDAAQISYEWTRE